MRASDATIEAITDIVLQTKTNLRSSASACVFSPQPRSASTVCMLTIGPSQLGSPQISPNKKAKKGKPSGAPFPRFLHPPTHSSDYRTGSPVSRVKADPDASGLPSSVRTRTRPNPTRSLTSTHIQTHYLPSGGGAHPKAPSKLRDSSTASFLDRSSSASRGSSPADGGTPASSFASQSPARPLINGRGGAVAARGRPPAMGTGPPKRPSPPRPPPVHYHMGASRVVCVPCRPWLTFCICFVRQSSTTTRTRRGHRPTPTPTERLPADPRYRLPTFTHLHISSPSFDYPLTTANNRNVINLSLVLFCFLVLVYQDHPYHLLMCRNGHCHLSNHYVI